MSFSTYWVLLSIFRRAYWITCSIFSSDSASLVNSAFFKASRLAISLYVLMMLCWKLFLFMSFSLVSYFFFSITVKNSLSILSKKVSIWDYISSAFYKNNWGSKEWSFKGGYVSIMVSSSASTRSLMQSISSNRYWFCWAHLSHILLCLVFGLRQILSQG